MTVPIPAELTNIPADSIISTSIDFYDRLSAFLYSVTQYKKY